MALVLALGVQAQQKSSVMFADTQPADITGKARAPLSFDDGPCLELAREVDALAGKPQRRMAAQQRYRARCGGDQQPFGQRGDRGPGTGGLGIQ